MSQSIAKNKSPSEFIKFSALFIAVMTVFSLLGTFAPQPRAVFSDAHRSQPITVVIDPGHGGEDGGACTYGGLAEKELNLLIANDLYLMLSSAGISSVMTRSDDVLLYDPDADFQGHKKSMDLAARLRIAREVPGGILISIHMNAFPESKYGGLQVYFSGNSEGGADLAATVQAKNKELLDPHNSRTIKRAGKNIYLLDRFEGTGVLIECGFLSNPRDRANLNDPEYRRKLATVIFFSIVEYLEGGGG